jgi:hypothetical protein
MSMFLQLSGILNSSNLKLGSIFLQHVLVVVFPELLGGVLAGDALEDLGSSRVLLNEVYIFCQSSSQVIYRAQSAVQFGAGGGSVGGAYL